MMKDILEGFQIAAGIATLVVLGLLVAIGPLFLAASYLNPFVALALGLIWMTGCVGGATAYMNKKFPDSHCGYGPPPPPPPPDFPR